MSNHFFLMVESRFLLLKSKFLLVKSTKTCFRGTHLSLKLCLHGSEAHWRTASFRGVIRGSSTPTRRTPTGQDSNSWLVMSGGFHPFVLTLAFPEWWPPTSGHWVWILLKIFKAGFLLPVFPQLRYQLSPGVNGPHPLFKPPNWVSIPSLGFLNILKLASNMPQKPHIFPT